MASDKQDDLSKSAPPRAALTDIKLLITLDRMRRSIDNIDKRLAAAEANDERFKIMETHFKAAKWFAAIAVVAAVGSLVTNVTARMSFRYSDPPSAATGRP